MTETLNSVIVGAVAGFLSAIITHLSTRAKIRLDLVAEYDKQLQESRLEAYKKLWPMLEPLARYGRAQPVTHAVLRSISDETRKWYFQTGGIYLTQRSRGPISGGRRRCSRCSTSQNGRPGLRSRFLSRSSTLSSRPAARSALAFPMTSAPRS